MQIRKWHAKIIAVLNSTLRSESLLGHNRDYLPKHGVHADVYGSPTLDYWLYIIHDIVWVRGMMDGERISSNTIATMIVPALCFSVCNLNNVVVSLGGSYDSPVHPLKRNLRCLFSPCSC